jgi:hypothetical protein
MPLDVDRKRIWAIWRIHRYSNYRQNLVITGLAQIYPPPNEAQPGSSLFGWSGRGPLRGSGPSSFAHGPTPNVLGAIRPFFSAETLAHCSSGHMPMDVWDECPIHKCLLPHVRCPLPYVAGLVSITPPRSPAGC